MSGTAAPRYPDDGDDDQQFDERDALLLETLTRTRARGRPWSRARARSSAVSASGSAHRSSHHSSPRISSAAHAVAITSGDGLVVEQRRHQPLRRTPKTALHHSAQTAADFAIGHHRLEDVVRPSRRCVAKLSPPAAQDGQGRRVLGRCASSRPPEHLDRALPSCDSFSKIQLQLPFSVMRLPRPLFTMCTPLLYYIVLCIASERRQAPDEVTHGGALVKEGVRSTSSHLRRRIS